MLFVLQHDVTICLQNLRRSIFQQNTLVNVRARTYTYTYIKHQERPLPVISRVHRARPPRESKRRKECGTRLKRIGGGGCLVWTGADSRILCNLVEDDRGPSGSRRWITPLSLSLSLVSKPVYSGP